MKHLLSTLYSARDLTAARFGFFLNYKKKKSLLQPGKLLIIFIDKVCS